MLTLAAVTPPVTGSTALVAAVALGAVFGVLLHRGGVANYNVIVNQFRFRDFTVLKIMMTAIIVGGLGVLALNSAGLANYHIKAANMLGIVIGAAIFGVGMVLYGYCPGTAIAAAASGSIHAVVGLAGLLVGGTLYAFSFPWIAKHILPVGALGKVRLPDVSGVPALVWFAALIAIALTVFVLIERTERRTLCPQSN
ncbi:YeeE/YedE thiosulfate transporter family protein [Horticoccus sp. 23ND18S-11]|uniref:YeeE/YedE thiosulfate transporter family protein n=1 Tax=Horticoccus sp. 23ND18S-11 TaxID=3391832 RepID=UPI0039C972C2